MKSGLICQLTLVAIVLTLWMGGCASSEVTTEEPVAAAAAARQRIDMAAARETLKAQLRVNESVNLCEGLVTHQNPLPIKRVQKPPFMKYYREPAFESRVIRITNSATHEVQKPAYSTMQAWNADESLLLLYRTNQKKNDYVLLDGQNYRFLKSLDIQAADIEQVFWSHTDPQTVFYMSNTSTADPDHAWFMRMNVNTGKRTQVRKFDRICPNAMPTSGNGVQMQSLDDDLFGFRCQLNPGHVMFSYRVSTDTVSHVKTGDGTKWDPWHAPVPGASGMRMEVQGRVVAPDLYLRNHTLDQAVYHEHGSMGRTSAGQDALFQVIFDPSPDGCNGDTDSGIAHLTEFNLESGDCRPVINQSGGWPYPTSGTHISAVAQFRPGWVAMSSIGYGQFENFDGKRKAPPLMSEIYLVNTDPDNTQLCRVAQHRSYGKDADNGRYHSYFGEPHVTISPSGTRLLFGSDWYDSGSVDSYVVELPVHRRQ